MIIPKDDECRQIVIDLKDEPNLSEWEYEFITSNATRTEFTDKQRAIFAKLKEKYDLE
jgi:hypothetical protein